MNVCLNMCLNSSVDNCGCCRFVIIFVISCFVHCFGNYMINCRLEGEGSVFDEG